MRAFLECAMLVAIGLLTSHAGYGPVLPRRDLRRACANLVRRPILEVKALPRHRTLGLGVLVALVITPKVVGPAVPIACPVFAGYRCLDGAPVIKHMVLDYPVASSFSELIAPQSGETPTGRTFRALHEHRGCPPVSSVSTCRAASSCRPGRELPRSMHRSRSPCLALMNASSIPTIPDFSTRSNSSRLWCLAVWDLWSQS